MILIVSELFLSCFSDMLIILKIFDKENISWAIYGKKNNFTYRR